MVNRIDIEKTEQFVASSIMSKFPDFTISKADPFYDLFIRVFTLSTLVDILKLVEQQEDRFGYTNFSLADSEYDLLLNRWFKSRIQGTKTTFSARLYFSVDTNLITVRKTDKFYVEENLFTPVIDEQIFASSYTKEIDILTNQALYYIDIPLEAQEITDQILATVGNTVVLPYTNITDFIKAVVHNDLVIGVASETNQEAYNRLQRTIGTDNWVNLNSFDVNFSERLPGIIKSYSIIGHGEPEMYRDLIQTGIPIRKFRLTFTEKVDLTLRQKNEDGVLVTTFLFNDDPDIIYTVKEDVIITKTSELWNTDLIGSYYVDIDITLLSSSNPLGFVEDVPVTVRQNIIDTLTNEILYSVLLESQITSFVGATSRNQRTELNLGIHFGGFTDTYVQTETIQVTRTIYVTPGSDGILAFPSDLIPVFKIIEILDESGVAVPIWNFVTGDVLKRYTVDDDSYLYVDNTYEGRTLTMTLIINPYMNLIHNTIKDPEKRIIQDNNIVKAKTPVFIDALIEVRLNSIPEAGVSSQITSSFTAYTNNLTDTDEFNINKALAYIEANIPEEVIIDSINITGIIHKPNGEEEYLEGDGVLKVIENLSIGLSSRTVQFITENIEIILV